MEAPQPPQRSRVQRKGRFTITEITPGSPQDAAAFQDVDDANDDGDYDADVPVAVAVSEAMAPNQALADTSIVVVVQQEQTHPDAQQMELSSPPPPSVPTTPLLQPQSPEEDVVMDKAPLTVVVPAVQEPLSLEVLSNGVTDPVVEPEPSPIIATVEVHEPQQQQQSPVNVDHVFIEYEYENDSTDSDLVAQSPPASIEEAPQQQLSPVLTVAESSLTIDITISDTTASAVASVGDDAAARGHSLQQQSSSENHHESLNLQNDDSAPTASNVTKVKRKSRFTITELTSDAPRSRENSNELFDPSSSYSTVTAYSAEFSQSQQFTSSEYGSATGGLFSSDYGTQPSQDGLIIDTTTASQDQDDDQLQLQQQQLQQQQDELDLQRMTRSLPSTRSPRSSATGRRATTRSVSPVRPALEMVDLVHESSGDAEFAADDKAEQQERESMRYHRERTWSTVGVSGHDSETNGNSHTPASYFANASAPMPSPVYLNGSGVRRGLFASENGGFEGRRHTGIGGGGLGSGSGRRHTSSRQKSITISAAQFLQQQQTIAALIRQQQELKHIVGVLQDQQQQLMSVPVQLHELRLENAKGDGKDEMMRELYVQVDSLMRANDSLQVLVTQAEKESQDRLQEAEFLTEENDQLSARCHYFERKYIEERKLTFVLEEEVQRFRMMSLTHELEQRNSVSQDAGLTD